MLCYCKKCGRIVSRLSKNKEKPCDYCNNTLNIIPKEFTTDGLGTCLDNDLKEQFINDYIKSSSEFDQHLFDHRDEDLYNRRMENEAKLEHGKAVLEGRDKGNPYGVTCPYCKATNVRKITIANKAVHTSIFGIWSIGRNSKQWHCDHCGSEF